MHVRTPWMIRAFALLAALSLASPAFAGNKFKKLPPERQAKYFGTQPGYHRLSDAFAIEVRDRLMTFYFLGATGDGDKTTIGVIAATWSEYSDFGPREIAYAISSDGKRLLFFDEPGVGDRPIAIKHGVGVADLYRMDADKGEKEIVYGEIHRRGFSCIEFPGNMVRFSQVRPGFQLDEFAYSTEGEEISVAERHRKLVEAKRVDQICGPL